MTNRRILPLRPLGKDVIAHRRIIGDGGRFIPVLSGTTAVLTSVSLQIL